MADFKYVALDRAGKKVTGSLAGRDEKDAAIKVKALGYFPVKVTTDSGNSVGRNVINITGGLTRPNIEGGNARVAEGTVRPTGKKVGRSQILLFTREISDLIDAGLPIDRALTVLIEQTDNEALRAMIVKMQGEIRAGQPLSDAMRAFPREFPPLYANMVRAGEVSGKLAEVLTRLADFMEKEAVRRSQVMAALTYPMVLVSVAVLAVVFLLVFVIPQLQGVFKDLGSALPIPTRMLLAMSAGIQSFWWALIGGIFVVVILFRAWAQTNAGRRNFDAFRLNVPLFGALTRKIVMARFVRTLGTLLAGGVPILDSLDISGSSVGNAVTSDAIAVARDGVRTGETLSGSMKNTGQFLPLVVHMTAVGEETGRLSGMLVRTADTLDFEVDNTMRRLTSLVEPLVVLLMGGFVGFVVLSILMPIFEANTLVK